MRAMHLGKCQEVMGFKNPLKARTNVLKYSILTAKITQ